MDLDGNAGAALFASAEPEIFSDTGNTGTAVLSGRITDVQALQASEYELRYDGASFTATRVVDGTTTTTGSVPLTIDGVELTMTGAPVAGDAFLLSATGRAAGSMESLVQNPEKLALAGQLATSSDIGNLGDTVISPATITDPQNGELTTPIDIIFTSETTYDIVDPESGTELVDEWKLFTE